MRHWENNMQKMKEMDADAHKWLEEMVPDTWVKAFFSTFPKCDVLLNNNCEVFNSFILEARKLPILSMLERIKTQIMTRHYDKQKEAENFVGTVCPKIRKKIAKNAESTNICYVTPSGQGVFQVHSRENTYIADIINKQCDCRR
jgi:hypothetical protein